MHRAFAPFVLLVACGSDPLEEEPTAEPETCPGGPSAGDFCADGPSFAEDVAPIEVGTVRARIVDESEAPLADLAVFVCGTKVCSLPERTDADGNVSISYPDSIEKPAFKYGDGLEVGRFFPLLPDSSAGTDLGTIATPRLPAPGACLVPGTMVESGGVRLTLLDEARIELLPIDYPEPEDRTFRAAELPLSLAPPGLDAGAGLDVIFALAPVGALMCPAAELELPNAGGYEPGTDVDILIHGMDVEELWAPYGGWQVIGVGRVDDAGERIEMTEGAGLPVITNIGVRAR